MTRKPGATRAFHFDASLSTQSFHVTKDSYMNVSELSGNALDWAVANCEDEWVCFRMGRIEDGVSEPYSPSTDWSQGGPIIEREWIEIVPWPNESDEELRWRATQYDAVTPVICAGPTALIAAMRCYVASKLGDDVEVPEEMA